MAIRNQDVAPGFQLPGTHDFSAMSFRVATDHRLRPRKRSPSGTSRFDEFLRSVRFQSGRGSCRKSGGFLEPPQSGSLTNCDQAPLPAKAARPTPVDRHSSAKCRHASAQAWQCSIECLRHWSAHASHISAHTRQISWTKGDPRLISPPAAQQMPAQSILAPMHSAIAWTSSSFRQAAEHRSHARAQRTHASIHDFCSTVIKNSISNVFRNATVKDANHVPWSLQLSVETTEGYA
jgi:hypothetical protein